MSADALSWLGPILDEVEHPPGLSDKKLDAFRVKFEKMFKTPLPDTYAELLRRTNGLNYNGVYIFGSKSDEDRYVESIKDGNYNTIDEGVDVRLFGFSDMVGYGYDPTTQKWVEVELAYLEDVADEYDSFDALLEEIAQTFFVDGDDEDDDEDDD